MPIVTRTKIVKAVLKDGTEREYEREYTYIVKKTPDDPTVIAEILAKYNMGVSVKALCAQYGKSYFKMRKILDRARAVVV